MHHRKSSDEDLTSKFTVQNSVWPGVKSRGEVQAQGGRVWRVNRPWACLLLGPKGCQAWEEISQHSCQNPAVNSIMMTQMNSQIPVTPSVFTSHQLSTDAPQLGKNLGRGLWDFSCEAISFTPLHREKIRKRLRKFRKKGYWHWDVTDVYSWLKHFLISFLWFKRYDKGSVNSAKYLLTFVKHPSIVPLFKSTVSTVVWNWLLYPPVQCVIRLSFLDTFWYFKMDPSPRTPLEVIS